MSHRPASALHPTSWRTHLMITLVTTKHSFFGVPEPRLSDNLHRTSEYVPISLFIIPVQPPAHTQTATKFNLLKKQWFSLKKMHAEVNCSLPARAEKRTCTSGEGDWAQRPRSMSSHDRCSANFSSLWKSFVPLRSPKQSCSEDIHSNTRCQPSNKQIL